MYMYIYICTLRSSNAATEHPPKVGAFLKWGHFERQIIQKKNHSEVSGRTGPSPSRAKGEKSVDFMGYSDGYPGIFDGRSMDITGE